MKTLLALAFLTFFVAMPFASWRAPWSWAKKDEILTVRCGQCVRIGPGMYTCAEIVLEPGGSIYLSSDTKLYTQKITFTSNGVVWIVN